jgi:DNA primase
MEEQIQTIKQKIDIVEFIGQYTQLKKSGRNYKANCPFHNEKTPSFVISPDRQIWHCFGTCGDGGDVIKFLMKMDNLSFIEALRELAGRVGVQLDAVAVNDNEGKIKDRIYAMNNWAAKYYSYILETKRFAKGAREYLENRGINEKIVKTFEIGYAPKSWSSLMEWLMKKGYSKEELLTAGLVVDNQRGNIYDRFRHRLVFPIKDSKGNIIAFSGRALDSEDQSAKYINTPESPVYRKRESLYGIHLAKDAIRKEANVYIVEGEFDMITPYMHGIENFVAIKGAALTTEQLQLLKRLTPKITLALDTDEAGIEAMKRGIREAEQFEFDIQVAQFTRGKDPDEAAKADFITFKKELHNAIPLYDFLFEVSKKNNSGDNAYSKKKIGDELVPYIRNIKNSIVQGHYIKQLATLLDVSVESVEKLVSSYRGRPAYRSSFLNKTQKQVSREDMTQKYLLSYLFQQSEPGKITKVIFEILTPEDFTIPALAKLSKLFMEYIQNNSQIFSFNAFSSTLPAELQPTADELFLYASGFSDMNNEKLSELVFELKERSCKRHIAHYSKLEGNDAMEKVRLYSGVLRKLDKKEMEKTLKT